MKALTRTFSYLLALLSTLLPLYPSSGKIRTMLFPLKLTAGALSPFLALAGSLGALLGLLRRDPKSTAAGLYAAILATRHIRRVTASHHGFERAFGPGWASRIPPEMRSRMLPHRWSLVRPEPPRIPWHRDLVFDTHRETGAPLLADLWEPPPGTPHSGLAIIYLHGSGWHYADKDLGTRYFSGTWRPRAT
jgi:hypothetical protein